MRKDDNNNSNIAFNNNNRTRVYNINNIMSYNNTTYKIRGNNNNFSNIKYNNDNTNNNKPRLLRVPQLSRNILLQSLVNTSSFNYGAIKVVASVVKLVQKHPMQIMEQITMILIGMNG